MNLPRVVLVALSLSSLATARAQEAPLGEPVDAPELYQQAAPEELAEPALIAPEGPEERDVMLTRRTQATWLLGVVGELGAMPRGQVGSGRNVVGGLAVHALVAPPHWPLLLGLGAGNFWLSSSSQRGPDVNVQGDFETFRSRTTVERSLEVRHFEGIVRLQPYFGRVRPYLEGSFGLGVLWQGADLEDQVGTVLARQERKRKPSWISGGAAGVDFDLTRSQSGAGLSLGVGVKVLRTGALPRIVFSEARDSYQVSSGRAQLTMWLPFVTVSFTF